MDKMMTSSERTHQTLEKHVGDCTDSDNEEKEDGELEEGEVEEEIDENPQQKDDAKENNRENNNNNTSVAEQESSIDTTNHSNVTAQKFRHRDYRHPQQQQSHGGHNRMNNSAGQHDKRNKHEQRRKRRHSGEDRDDRNRRVNKRGRFRGGPMPDLPEDGDEDDMIGQTWPPRGPNRSQRRNPTDNTSNENSEPTNSTDQTTSVNASTESKGEQSSNHDETSSPINEPMEDDNGNVEEKQERSNRPGMNRNNSQQNSGSIENRGRRYYDGNSNNNSNNNNRRNNGRDRSSWQDRSGGNNNNSNNSRFRSEMNSNSNHGPPLCKFFMENRCMKGNDCQYSHDVKPPKKMEVCKYYVQNKGYCQKNDSCHYLHAEFPCKFFHTETADCKQGDRCKFSHEPITNEDIRFAFQRYLQESDDMNRPNRGNSNSNLHHGNNQSSMNMTEPGNFQNNIPNLMDYMMPRNNTMKSSPTTDFSNSAAAEGNVSNTTTSQSSPPTQRPSVFNDTLMSEKTETDESSSSKSVTPSNSATSPTSSSTATSTTASTSDGTAPTTVSTVGTSGTTTTTTTSTSMNSSCPLPLPPTNIGNTNISLPSPFGRLPATNLTRPPNSLLPPPPPGLFPLNTFGTGRVPIIFPPNSGIPLPPPPPPNSLIDVELLARAAALAAVATNFNASNVPQPQSTSPQLGRDIDERDRQSSSTMRDIDERPSEAFSRGSNPSSNLGLLQPSPTMLSPTSATTSSIPSNEDQAKSKTIQDIFRTSRPSPSESAPSSATSNSSAGPSFDFISMLEQLKQPRQTQSIDNLHDSLEIRTSSTPTSVYNLRPVYVLFKPYPLPDASTSADPRLVKYQEKMSQWSDRARFERYNASIPSTNHYSVPLRTQQQTLINDPNLSRDPRLLRNSVSSGKVGVSALPTATPFARPNDNTL